MIKKTLQKSSSTEHVNQFFKETWQDQGLECDNLFINHDPVLTLSYFTTRSKLASYVFVEWGKLLLCHLKGKNLQDIDKKV